MRLGSLLLLLGTSFGLQANAAEAHYDYERVCTVVTKTFQQFILQNESNRGLDRILVRLHDRDEKVFFIALGDALGGSLIIAGDGESAMEIKEHPHIPDVITVKIGARDLSKATSYQARCTEFSPIEKL